MDERQALLAAVLAEPDDDLPRLVYADWLDEHGEADRAELIRLQCRPGFPDHHAPGDPAWDRAFEIKARHSADWLGPAAGFLFAFDGPNVPFIRGFPYLAFLVEHFAAPECQRVVCEWFPVLGVEGVHLARTGPLRPPSLGLIVRMVFSGSAAMWVPTPEEVVRAALGSPALAWVSRLSLSSDLTTDRSLGVLVRSPHLGRLGSLSLSGVMCMDGGLNAVSRAVTLPNLREFACTNLDRHERFTTRGVRSVLASSRLPRLSRLTLNGPTPPRVNLATLLADTAAARLTHLHLAVADALAVVGRSRTLTRLESLVVSGEQAVVDGRDLEHLLGNPALARLRSVMLVHLQRNNVNLSEATTARLRERFGDDWTVRFAQEP